MGKIRWAILGTGNIARQFATGLKAVSDAKLLAVGSRSAHNAEKFAADFSVPRIYPTYQQLANDPDLDIIYIATPHPFHMENSILCLKAGRSVLCEKPFAINAKQAKKMITAAKANKVFLMEAMWTRFLPAVEKVRKLLDKQIIGRPQMVQANFGFKADAIPKHRLLNPKLGGGALLDVGVYCISFASMVFNKPAKKITSMAHIGKTGVDEQSAYILGYDKDQMAVLTSTLSVNTENDAIITGTKGSIKIHSPFWIPTKITVTTDAKGQKIFELPITSNGYNYQAEHVNKCLKAVKSQSDVMPLNETLEIMKTMDKIRSQWDMEYPDEK